MLETERCSVPLSGRVTLHATVFPRELRRSDASLAELARRVSDSDRETQFALVRKEAHRDATENAARALEAAAEKLTLAVDRAEEALGADVVELGVEIARQILKLEIDQERYDLERIVRSTLGASDIKRGTCRVFLNPADADMLSSVTFRDETTVVRDHQIARGTVHVETPRGLLVRDPSAALDEIREQLLEDLV